MNPVFRDLFAAKVAGAVTAAKALGHLDHDGVKGWLREVLMRDLLRPFLPPTIGMGHGIVIDSYGSQSPQQDLVLFSHETIPSLLVDEECGLFPVESVLFTVEIKSTLTSTTLKDAL